MTIKRWDGASYIDLTVLKRWDGASWVNITSAKRWDGATWVTIPLPGAGLQISASAATVSGYQGRGPTCPPCPAFVSVTSNSVTVTPTGGIGAGPTILWEYYSGDTGVNATAPTSFTTQFQANVQMNTTKLTVYRATVTQGADVRVLYVTVSLEYAFEAI